MNDEQDQLVADAAAVDTAEPVAPEPASHVARPLCAECGCILFLCHEGCGRVICGCYHSCGRAS